MLTHRSDCTVCAEASYGFVDVTREVESIVAASGIRNGRVTVLRPAAGCSLVLNEQEKGLHADVQSAIRRIGSNGSGIPPVGSASLVLPIVDGRIRLGTWQRILMIELEEPQDRPLSVQVVGE